MKLNKKQVKRAVMVVALAAVVVVLREMGVITDAGSDSAGTEPAVAVGADARGEGRGGARGSAGVGTSDRLERAIDNEESGVMTDAKGVVVKVLPDDREGDRHQRFIIKLSSGRTVLIAHNIDLAPRVPIEEIDIVEVYGQFEWNDRGGVMHWTHHDPDGRHEDGWIRHEGSLYQ